MNRLDWIEQKLHLRTALYPCSVNVLGETYPATVEPIGDRDRLRVSFEDRALCVYLEDLDVFGKSSLLLFRTSDPNGLGGVLIVPEMPE